MPRIPSRYSPQRLTISALSRLAPHAIERFSPAIPAPDTGPEGVRLLALTLAECRDPQRLAQWQALALSAAQPNPFVESWFTLPSLEAFDPDGTVRVLWLEVAGQVAGIMPVRHYPSYYGYPLPHLRNWVHDNAFCGQPLVVPGMATLFWRGVLGWCDARPGKALFLHLTQMPLEGEIHHALKDVLATQHRPAATVQQAERAMLTGTLAPEAYLEASLTGKKRKELRRQYRRLEELGALAITRTARPDAVATWAGQFMALEDTGWKGAAGSALARDAAKRAWFPQVLTAAAEAGRLECLSLTLDGQPLAMLVNFLTAPGCYSFKTAFDEQFARFSPGVLLQVENMDLLERADIAWSDSCAAPDHLMIDHLWRERRTIASHSIAIGGSARRTLFKLLARRETGTWPGGIT